jgi:hypothetical protein
MTPERSHLAELYRLQASRIERRQRIGEAAHDLFAQREAAERERIEAEAALAEGERLDRAAEIAVRLGDEVIVGAVSLGELQVRLDAARRHEQRLTDAYEEARRRRDDGDWEVVDLRLRDEIARAKAAVVTVETAVCREHYLDAMRWRVWHERLMHPAAARIPMDAVYTINQGERWAIERAADEFASRLARDPDAPLPVFPLGAPAAPVGRAEDPGKSGNGPSAPAAGES